MRLIRSVVALLVAFAVVSFGLARSAAAGEHLTILVPKDGNLQYMSFWVAQAGGFFTREGVDVEMVFPSAPQQAETMFESGKTEAAVLAPPMYLRFIGAKVPIVLVANLLRNDPIDLIVRKSILEERKLTTAMPLKERLAGLKGLRLGVAPHPPSRLRALYASVGLDADKELELVILKGHDQNEAFTEGKVDALYAHTPYLEKAIVQDGASILVDQTHGEIAALSNRQIHCLAFRRSVADARPNLVISAARAIAAAEKSIHTSQKETVDLLAKMFPDRDRRELEVAVRLYEPAIPDEPDVHVEDLAPALALFPDGLEKPDLSKMDLAPYVAKGLAAEIAKPAPEERVTRARVLTVAVAFVCVFGVLAGILKGRMKRGD